MKFLNQDNKKHCIVISDLHLGGGDYIDGKKNILEEFHCDGELIEFLNYYGRDQFFNRDVELVINGDFLDFLAIPFIPFFDDEFWTEKASLAKLEKIISSHNEVFYALDNFLRRSKKKMTYIIGNHDAEMLFPKVRELFLSQFSSENRSKITFWLNGEDYSPFDGVVIRHGHQYESPHNFHNGMDIKKDENGENYIVPPWGFLYITRILNKFKEERPFIDSIRPIRNFIINGLLFDTLLTLRFILANFYYFIVVVVGDLFRKKRSSLRNLLKSLATELEIFKDYEEILVEEFQKEKNLRVLIVGHTHVPFVRNLKDGEVIINTGSWVDMYHLDFSNRQYGRLLTYASLDFNQDKWGSSVINSSLLIWKGKSERPFRHFY